MENLNKCLSMTTDNTQWSKHNELYKFYDEIKFKIVWLEWVYASRNAFVTESSMQMKQSSQATD